MFLESGEGVYTFKEVFLNDRLSIVQLRLSFNKMQKGVNEEFVKECKKQPVEMKEGSPYNEVIQGRKDEYTYFPKRKFGYKSY